MALKTDSWKQENEVIRHSIPHELIEKEDSSYSASGASNYSEFSPNSSFPSEVEKEWFTGIIVSVTQDSFFCEMEDLKGNISEIEFEREEVSPLEQSLIQIGARFTYSVSLLDKETGRTYVTNLAIQEPVPWNLTLEKETKNIMDTLFPETLFTFGND